MIDRPIIFSAPMVRALLDARKTMTRRVLKPQPDTSSDRSGRGRWGAINPAGYWYPAEEARPYAPGDRLWAREAWRTVAAYDDLSPSQMGGEEPVRYEADHAIQMWGWARITTFSRYRHARFMPRWASRLTLTVTDVRVQRLQEISEDDARAEGCGWRDTGNPHDNDVLAGEPRLVFARLWNSLHGPDAWAANPWVAAISFTVERRNIDQMEAA